MRIAVIDLGFNSLKMVVYSVGRGKSFVAYEQRAVMVRLGEGLSRTGFLGGEVVSRAIEGLKLFWDIARFERVEQTLPVATSAVREAANRDEFLRKVEDETGFRFRILSSRQEAVYSFKGAAQSTRLPNVIFFDLGGGTLEILYSRDFVIKNVLSLPLGGLRLTEQYANSEGVFSEKQHEKMERHISDLLPVPSEFGRLDDTVLLGVGGNLRALAKYDQELVEYPLNKLHGYVLERERLETIHESLLELSVPEISEIDAIGSARAKTVVAGCCVVDVLMKKLGFTSLFVSTHGLRDGVLSSYLENPNSYSEPVDERQVEASLKRNAPAPLKTAQVLDSLHSLGFTDGREKEIALEGLAQTLSKPRRYGAEALFYILVEEDTALSHADQVIMSLSIVRTKSPRIADWLYSRYKSFIRPKNKETIKKLSSLIGLLELLERSDARVTADIAEAKKIVIRVKPEKNEFPSELIRYAVGDLQWHGNFSIDYSIDTRVTRPSPPPPPPQTR